MTSIVGNFFLLYVSARDKSVLLHLYKKCPFTVWMHCSVSCASAGFLEICLGGVEQRPGLGSTQLSLLVVRVLNITSRALKNPFSMFLPFKIHNVKSDSTYKTSLKRQIAVSGSGLFDQHREP